MSIEIVLAWRLLESSVDCLGAGQRIVLLQCRIAVSLWRRIVARTILRLYANTLLRALVNTISRQHGNTTNRHYDSSYDRFYGKTPPKLCLGKTSDIIYYTSDFDAAFRMAADVRAAHWRSCGMRGTVGQLTKGQL